MLATLFALRVRACTGFAMPPSMLDMNSRDFKPVALAGAVAATGEGAISVGGVRSTLAGAADGEANSVAGAAVGSSGGGEAAAVAAVVAVCAEANG